MKTIPKLNWTTMGPFISSHFISLFSQYNIGGVSVKKVMLSTTYYKRIWKILVISSYEVELSKHKKPNWVRSWQLKGLKYFLFHYLCNVLSVRTDLSHSQNVQQFSTLLGIFPLWPFCTTFLYQWNQGIVSAKLILQSNTRKKE